MVDGGEGAEPLTLYISFFVRAGARGVDVESRNLAR